MSTFIVGILLSVLVIWILRTIYKDHKAGKCSGCSKDCGCCNTAHSGSDLFREYKAHEHQK